MGEAALDATVEALGREVAIAECELDAARRASEIWLTDEVKAGILARQDAPQDKEPDSTRQEAWFEMLYETQDIKLAISRRRLLLTKYELLDVIYPRVVCYPNPEANFHIAGVAFTDKLAAVDPTQELEPMVVFETSPVFLAFADPIGSVSHWLEKRKSEGRQWTFSAERQASRKAVRQDFFALQRQLFPTQEELAAARSYSRRLEPEEVKETLRTLRHRTIGDTPQGIEDQIRAMDLNNMTPAEALATLYRLQAEAKRYISPTSL